MGRAVASSRGALCLPPGCGALGCDPSSLPQTDWPALPRARVPVSLQHPAAAQSGAQRGPGLAGETARKGRPSCSKTVPFFSKTPPFLVVLVGRVREHPVHAVHVEIGAPLGRCGAHTCRCSRCNRSMLTPLDSHCRALGCGTPSAELGHTCCSARRATAATPHF